MLIGSYPVSANGTIPKVNIFTPCSELLIVVKHETSYDLLEKIQNPATISVKLQNSETGKSDDILPSVRLGELAEISAYNQGTVIMTSGLFIYPVMLNPVGNINLSNNKFLEIELKGLIGPSVEFPAPTVEIYTVTTSVMSDFVTKYEHLTIPQGVTRQVFDTKEIEFVLFPQIDAGLDSIRMTHNNGVVVEMSKIEMIYNQFKNNEITAVILNGLTSGMEHGENATNVMYGMGTSAILNLSEVKSIEIIRETMASEDSYRILTGNLK
jgi:hypothetical protein